METFGNMMGGCFLQKELLCQQAGLSSSISHEAFQAAIYERLGQDDFGMDTLRWWVTVIIFSI